MFSTSSLSVLLKAFTKTPNKSEVLLSVEGHCIWKSFVSIRSSKCTSFCDFGFISQFRFLVYVNGFAKYIIIQTGTVAQWLEVLPSKPDKLQPLESIWLQEGANFSKLPSGLQMNWGTNMDANGHILHKISFKILRHIISYHSNDEKEMPHFTQLKNSEHKCSSVHVFFC